MLQIALALLMAFPSAAAAPAKKETAAVLRLSARAEKHVRESHFTGGKKSRGKSLFLPDTDLSELVKKAEASKPRRQKNGRDKRVAAGHSVIGTSGRTGAPLKTYVVIAEPDGGVVTMYPGR
ncbi:MAG: hypothetical protein COV48_04060 [Elusimicrobia bacterium CG11_big_fil_rev_8_21_14_0_20_64_6]|nr:MAG: hypothetical protein COV48_04060 [Elusimicrobia bacterium CG11_big_fil_rev_8_21_14_0_20_64_6]